MATAYELLEESKKKQQAAIAEAHKAQEGEKKLREHNAQQQLEANNRGVYTTYKNAINPFGVTASQNNMPTGVSDYMKNAAYGTMLQGLGRNQTNFTTEMNNSNTLWQNWLAEKAGKEATIEDNYATAMLAAKGSSSGGGYSGYTSSGDGGDGGDRTLLGKVEGNKRVDPDSNSYTGLNQIDPTRPERKNGRVIYKNKYGTIVKVVNEPNIRNEDVSYAGKGYIKNGQYYEF